MTRGHWISGVVLICAITAGTWRDRSPAPEPQRTGGIHVLAADLHVHSFFGDGALAPWELPREARRRGLDVIAVANHNTLLGSRLAAAFAGALPIVLVSQEVTTPTFHLIAAGIGEIVDWRLPAGALLQRVHELNGLAIAAHPVRDSWRETAEGLLGMLDGAEVAHPADRDAQNSTQLREFYARARQVNRALAPVGSSDFHVVRPVGEYRTYVLAHAVNAEAVVQAIREGRTVAQSRTGDFFGAPAHVDLVREHLASRPPAAGTDHADTLLAAVVLLSLGRLAIRG